MRDQKEPINILIVEDNKGDSLLLHETLELSTLTLGNLYNATDLKSTFLSLTENKADIVLLDLSLPDSKGLETFLSIHNKFPQLPVVILTGLADTNLALEAINSGAQDFLVKGNYDELLLSKTILYSIERQRISESLRISNERYNLVAKATNDMVWDWDLVTNQIFRNKEGWVKVFGETEGINKLDSESWMERIHPDDRVEVEDELTRIINDKSVHHFEIECRMRRNDGGHIFVIDRGYAIRDKEGKAIRLIGATQNVNERKLAEEELKRLSLIARETQNMVVITDRDGNITWVNQAFVNITGYSISESLGKNPRDFLQGPETSPVVKRYMRQKIKAVQPFECDLVNYTRSGEKYWIRIQCQPQFNTSGQLISFFAIQTDITQEKEAEQNLVNSERKFRALIENSKDGLTIVGKDGVVQDISISGQKILGYTKEEYIGVERLNLVHPDDSKIVDSAFRAVIKDANDVRTIEYRFRRADGTYTWIESAFHNLLEEPTIGAVVLHFREINDRKIAADMLKESEEKYRNLFTNIPSAIFIWSPETLDILEVNEAAVQQYGYSRDEFLIMKVTALSPENNGDNEIVALSKVLLANKDYKSNAIWQHVTKGGKEKFMDITFQAIDYYGKKASLAIVSNITEQIELEMELSSERLKKQQEITAAVITAQEQEREQLGKELHDNINQILATTRLYIEYGISNESMREQLMHSAKDFIMSAVEEIRALSKSLLPPSLGEIGLLVAVDELLESIRRINTFVFHTDLDDIDERVLSEELKLTIFRIIQEQLNNIIKHAEAKNVWIKIKSQNQRLLISVRDDGQGFNMAERSSGVGLKNISSRAGLHNGTMQMQTAPGKGCELKVAFSL